ncbi:MAG: radical SAM protein [Desulfatirhabdiaceae bacterium]
MKILLVSANTESINMPTLPVGLGWVAASAIHAGHTVRFVDLMMEPDPLKNLASIVDEFRPEAIGISIRNIDDQSSRNPKFLLENARHIVSVCKERSAAPVILGGAGYSIFPQSALAYLGADMGIQGEGETAFLALLDCLAGGGDVRDVPGLFLPDAGCRTPRAYTRKLDTLPPPDPRLFHLKALENPAYFLPVQTRRGCPLKCSYCSTAAIEGGTIRKLSIPKVVSHLLEWKTNGAHQVFFVDNIFNLPPGYAETLCREMILARCNLKWRCILYPGNVTESLVIKMAEAGCTDVSLGFESGDNRMLHAMNKRFKIEDIRYTAGILADHGIRCMGFLLLGGPGETRETVLQSLAFAESLNLDTIRVTAGIRIYPYTELARTALQEGVISPSDTLLKPRFYMADKLGDWLYATLETYKSAHPNWIF